MLCIIAAIGSRNVLGNTQAASPRERAAVSFYKITPLIFECGALSRMESAFVTAPWLERAPCGILGDGTGNSLDLHQLASPHPRPWEHRPEPLQVSGGERNRTLRFLRGTLLQALGIRDWLRR